MSNKTDLGKTVVFEYSVLSTTSQSLPSLPACLTTPHLPDFTEHTSLEEEIKPLLNRTSTLRQGKHHIISTIFFVLYSLNLAMRVLWEGGGRGEL